MTMRCEHVRDTLGELATGELRAQTAEEVAAHLETCPVCKREAAEMRATVETLRAVKLPTLPDGFDGKLRARLEGAGRPEPGPAPLPEPRRRGVPLPVVIGAVVAVLAIAAALLSTGGPAPPRRRAMPAATADISTSEPSKLRLTFTTETSVPDVEIRIAPPAGVRLTGAPPGGELVIKRDLLAGDNTIPIEIQGEKPGAYRLVARAAIGGTEVIQEVYLQVR